MTDNIDIRSATEKDIPILQKLQADNVPEADGTAWTEYDWLTNIHGGFNFVAESGGRIVGYICGERLLGDGAVLHFLIMEERYRSGKISLALFSHFERLLKDDGVKWYLTYARPRVAAFLEKRGAFVGEEYAEVLKYL